MPASTRPVTVALLVTLLVAAGLRFNSLDFGAGDFEARPDETGVVLTLAAMQRAQFFPTLVLYGGGYFHPLDLFVRLWGTLLWDSGVSARVAAGDLEGVRIAARTWSSLLALATVALVYVVGRRSRGERVGVLAAALLAVAPLAVREAHFAKADTAATAAVSLLMAALVLPRSQGRWRAVLVGAATALALSTKMLAGVVPVAAFALAWPSGAPGRRVDWRALAWGAGACTVGLVALNTFVWRYPSMSALSARHVLNALRHATWLPGADLVAGPLVYHTTISLRWGVGLAFTLLALPAVVFGMMHRAGGLRLLALLTLGHWAMLLASPMVLARFLLPALPPLAVLVAAMLVAAVDRAVALEPRRRAVLAVAALIVTIEPLVASFAMVRLLGRADTRTLAGEWIDAHIAPDARVVSWGAPPGAADFGRPPLHGRSVQTRLPPDQWDSAGVTIVVWHHYPLPYSSDPLPNDGVGLRRLATFDPFIRGAAVRAVLEPLDAFYLPLGRFAGVERPGPRIDILTIDPGAFR
mgnify:CR=1 FL=1